MTPTPHDSQEIHDMVLDAAARISGHVRKTPVDPCPRLSRETGADVWLKLENIQHTGSFKFRGAANKVLGLDDEQRKGGVIAASTGNHGLAVARAAKSADVEGIICLPSSAAPAKIQALEEAGATVEFHGDDCDETEMAARAIAEKNGLQYISPYNDPDVIAGQGTMAPEMVGQLENLDVAFVSVGGGGLISGIAAYLHHACPHVKVIGCLPENSPVMYESVEAGEIVPYRSMPTLSDGTAGGMEPGAITFDLCRELIHDWVLVTEDEIRSAMRFMVEAHHMIVEGSAGVAIGACLKAQEHARGKSAAIVICGGNVGMETLGKVLGA